jgi:hypothetical protein
MQHASVWVAAGLLLTPTGPGCSPSPSPEVAAPAEESVTLDRIPEGIREAARQRLPGVAFREARMIRSGGGLAYELRGETAEGQARKVQVSAAGKVLAAE